ncbi:MAG: type IV pili methyl-accepting chemotaxis transducer N-terminal domain-containing protein [Proteobacteria bacterium]|nr:type IV pili methyl-accepting chemotaxis transducer N-terminal domain-containing protein [Pseudomonadota bacterium]
MASVLLVFSSEADAAGASETLRALLADTEFANPGETPCRSMVRKVAADAPQQVLLCATHVGQEAALLDALKGWQGVPPCALSLLCEAAPQDPQRWVERGVHAWAALGELDAQRLALLLREAQGRWQREADLRADMDALRTRLDERKWIDRAKGLLMSARGIAEDEAFVMLRGAAMHANLRLGEVSRSLLEAAQWAESINRAGQLRMLSQRLARLAAQEVAGIDVQRGRVLRKESMQRVQQNLEHLDGLVLDTRAAHSLVQVRRAWEPLSVALDERAAVGALTELDERAETLLGAAEALTGALEATGSRNALHIVNICGRQRMRAQRLAKDALLASLLGTEAPRARLMPTMDEFEAALVDLEQTPLSSAEIRSTIAQARDEWLLLVGGVRNAGKADGRIALVRASEALLVRFDQLTAAYERSLQVIMS